MIYHFWNTGALPHNFIAGVMKVIPKKVDKRHLRDWRLLAMLTIIYKLIASILSNRLSPASKGLISPQQTGFIPGRSILENISLAWTTIERITKLKIPTLLILLHSEKAFDRVKHPFISAVLEKIGLGSTFLLLVQGLLRMASSKVHVKGRFTKEIQLTRGVRWGCPLSPLLFCYLYATSNG